MIAANAESFSIVATPSRLDLRVSSLIRAIRARFARAQSIHGAPGDFFRLPRE